MKWNYFAAAVLIVGAAMMMVGAPLFSVLAGTAFAALWNWRKRRLV